MPTFTTSKDASYSTEVKDESSRFSSTANVTVAGPSLVKEMMALFPEAKSDNTDEFTFNLEHSRSGLLSLTLRNKLHMNYEQTQAGFFKKHIEEKHSTSRNVNDAQAMSLYSNYQFKHTGLVEKPDRNILVLHAESQGELDILREKYITLFSKLYHQIMVLHSFDSVSVSTLGSGGGLFFIHTSGEDMKKTAEDLMKELKKSLDEHIESSIDKFKNDKLKSFQAENEIQLLSELRDEARDHFTVRRCC